MSVLTCRIKDGLFNLGYNIKLMPLMIELNMRANKMVLDEKIEKRKTERAAKKEEKSAANESDEDGSRSKSSIKDNIKKEKKLNSLYGTTEVYEPISQEMCDKILKMVIEKDGGPGELLNMNAKAIKTNKWIEYAFYFMMTPGAERIKEANEAERELVNGIASLFDFPKIYDSSEIMNLNFYDTTSELYSNKFPFLLSVKELKAKATESVLKQIENNKNIILGNPSDEDIIFEESEGREVGSKPNFINEDDLDVERPVTFDKLIIDNYDVPPLERRGAGISDELYQKLEDTFHRYLCNEEYGYELNGLLVNINIKRRTGVVEQYIVDPYGNMLGFGKVAILANAVLNGVQDRIFVICEDHPDLMRNILGSHFYYMTEQELQNLISSEEYFANLVLYRYIDMQNTEFLSKLSREDFIKLGKKLTFIINNLGPNAKSVGSDVPRMRFNHFESVDDFIIISDRQTKSPLSATNETSSVMVEGMMFEVKGDDITQRYMGESNTLHIDNYNMM